MEILKDQKDLIFQFLNEYEDPVFIFEINAKIETFYYANPAFYNILGYDQKEVTKLKFKDLFPKIDKNDKDNFIKIIGEKNSVSFSTYIQKKDQTYYFSMIKLYLYKKLDKVYIIGFCKNQTEKNIFEYRKYISEFLLANFQKEQIESDLILKVAESIFVFLNSNILFYYPVNIQNDNSRLYYMNNSALMVTSEEELLEPFIQIIENNINIINIKKEPILFKQDIYIMNFLNPNYKNLIQFNTNSDKINCIIIPIYIEDKLQAIVNIFTLKDQFTSDEINLIRFTFQGILIFKIKENYLKDLRYTKQCFTDLLNYSVEMHYRQALPDRKIEYISSCCEKITGFTKEEILNEPHIFYDRILEEDKQKFSQNFNLKKDDIKPNDKLEFFIEYRFVHKDGSIIWLSDLFIVIFDENKKSRYIFGSIRDITKQKEDEENLKNLQNQMAQKQKMEAVGRFSSEIVHDFNNIIGGLDGNIKLALSNIDKIKQNYLIELKKLNLKNLSDDLDEIEDNLNDSLIILKKSQENINRIKSFTKPKSVKQQTIDLNETINEFKPIFNYSNKDKVKIEYNFKDKNILININKSQFEQIILNLMINAFDAIKKKDGKIIISTEIVKNLKFFDSDKDKEKKNVFAKISISDNGCGMDEKILVNIFEPFFTTKGKKGTGLGLSIVYSLVKQNNGYIDVSSKVNFGTTFNIYFPIDKIVDKGLNYKNE